MTTKTFWIWAIFIALMAFLWYSFFGNLWNAAPEIKNPQIFYSDDGGFIYTGSLISTITGATNFFTNKTGITDIKTLKSEKNFLPRFYIEYPNFAELQNIEILSNIRKKIMAIANKDNAILTEKPLGYHANFSLNEGHNIGSVIYEIFRDNPKTTEKIEMQTFLIDNNGNFINPALLLNSEKTTELTKNILDNFQQQYPQITPYSSDNVQQNLIASLQNGNFIFSWENVIFYLNSEIFTENTKNLEKIIPITIPYTTISDKIFTEIKIPKKPETKTNTKTEQKSWKSSDWKKYVALTFDDGPHKSYTQNLLDTLKTKNVKATFFVLGQNAEKYPDIMKRIAEAGHEIGNHSWNHTSFKKLSKQAMRDQITKTDFVIKNATGIDITMFRPPYGAYDKTTQKTVDKAFIMWSVDSLDWKNRNIEKNLKMTMSQIHDGAIILYHDIHKTSVDTIPTLIDRLRAAGYEFLTVSELYEKYYHDWALLPGQVCFSMNRCK